MFVCFPAAPCLAMFFRSGDVVIENRKEKVMITHILTHDHRHGVDTYLFKSEKNREIDIHSECYEDRKEIAILSGIVSLTTV